jgi:hypothetical protein
MDPELLKSTRMPLLKALAKDEGFAASLKDEKLDKCAVLVHTKRIAGKVPTAEEEKTNAEELVGADTIGDLVRDATMVFIRVELPPTAGEGSCPCSPLTRSPPPCADG